MLFKKLGFSIWFYVFGFSRCNGLINKYTHTYFFDNIPNLTSYNIAKAELRSYRVNEINCLFIIHDVLNVIMKMIIWSFQQLNFLFRLRFLFSAEKIYFTNK